MLRCEMKMKDWVGRLVRLRRNVVLRSGAVYRKNQIFYVYSHHRGRLTLILGSKPGPFPDAEWLYQIDREWVSVMKRRPQCS